MWRATNYNKELTATATAPAEARRVPPVPVEDEKLADTSSRRAQRCSRRAGVSVQLKGWGRCAEVLIRVCWVYDS